MSYRLLEDRNPKYDSLIGGFAVSMLAIGNYSLNHPPTIEFPAMAIGVFLMATTTLYIFLNKKVKEHG
jgi:hypothetical protein